MTNETTTKAASPLLESLAERFAQISQPPSSYQTKAWEQFAKAGLPTTKSEDWRYTSLKPLLSQTVPKHPVSSQESDEALRLSIIARTPAHDANIPTLVVHNGRLVGDVPAATGVSLVEFNSLPSEESARLVDPQTLTAMGNLNTAFGSLWVVCIDKTDAPVALQVIVSHDAESFEATHPRLIWRIAPNANLELREWSIGGGALLSNHLQQWHLGKNSHVRHARWFADGEEVCHLSETQVVLGRDAQYQGHVFQMQGQNNRVAYDTKLAESGSSFILKGLGVSRERQHRDLFAHVEHIAPHCTSAVKTRGVVSGHASSSFNSKALVRKEAAHTDAIQNNRNLLLTEHATAYTRPQLEIYADEVKCAHGTTVGQLDEKQIFYLRSRGLSKDVARRELTVAFGREMFDGLWTENWLAALEEQLRQLVTSA